MPVCCVCELCVSTAMGYTTTLRTIKRVKMEMLRHEIGEHARTSNCGMLLHVGHSMPNGYMTTAFLRFETISHFPKRSFVALYLRARVRVTRHNSIRP